MAEDHSGRRVLIADDEHQVANALTALVRRQFGCLVDTVFSGDEAIQALGGNSYDLLITDMRMPGLSGLELVERVAKEWPCIDILVSTAYADDFPYVEVIRLGASDFLTKPFPAAALEARVLRLFRGRALYESALSDVPVSGDGQQSDEPLPSGVDETDYRQAFEHNIDGLLILEAETRQIKDVNRAFCRLIGEERESLLGRSFLDFFSENECARLKQTFALFAEAGQGAMGGVCPTRADGKPVCLDLSVSFIERGKDRFVQVSCKDATERDKLTERLAEFAQTDPLTGLLNRRMMHMHLETAVAQAESLGWATSLLFIDLDYFKECNDTYGHQTGDELLKVTADVIRRHTRARTDEAFRYGGDEFAVLLTTAGLEVGTDVAERIHAEYGSEDRHGTTMSIGVIQLEPDMDAEAFVKAADVALYRAKDFGKNQVCAG